MPMPYPVPALAAWGAHHAHTLLPCGQKLDPSPTFTVGLSSPFFKNKIAVETFSQVSLQTFSSLKKTWNLSVKIDFSRFFFVCFFNRSWQGYLHAHVWMPSQKNQGVSNSVSWFRAFLKIIFSSHLSHWAGFSAKLSSAMKRTMISASNF